MMDTDDLKNIRLKIEEFDKVGMHYKVLVKTLVDFEKIDYCFLISN